jgi:hypothetical protein
MVELLQCTRAHLHAGCVALLWHPPETHNLWPSLFLGMCRRDYYDLLQVPKGASEAVIKRSFRKLALKYHPVRVV